MMIREKELFDLVDKYNVPGPRYTSYPTAVQFTEVSDKESMVSRLERRGLSAKQISLYFHIPFCFSLCWYCGCTKIITRDQDRGDVYLDYLEKEAALVAKSLHSDSSAKQIHFGGGTPTFLNPGQLSRLGEIIRNHFTIDQEAEFSVEIDPRKCTEDHIIALKEMGVNRASLGIQDTNEEVQKAIHRIQPFEQTTEVTNLLRKHGIININFDLIYGLPKQTLDTFADTIKEVTSLNPDRFAVYSYAHIPSIMPAQKLLNENDLPEPGIKLSMLMMAIDQLEELGYRYIGMDHFSREEDELSKALDDGTLQRNFQGYSTHADMDLYALGMSGISMVDSIYYQNSKDLGRYYSDLDQGKLPIVKQLMLTEDDRIRRDWISNLMCKPQVDLSLFSQKWEIDVKEYFSKEWGGLKELEEDGLILVKEESIQITEKGRLFLRNIAMVFDAYLTSIPKKHYSATV
jgi:oxygen-independent coproporphyrinogen III oxidase